MKKRIGAAMTALCAVLLLASPSLGAGDGTRYFLGTGADKGSEILFAVKGDSVKRLLVVSGRTTCGKGKKWKGQIVDGLPGAKLDGRSFVSKRAEGGINSAAAGKIRKADAEGRMRLAGRLSFDGELVWCRSGRIDWSAEPVPFEEWKAARDKYTQPPAP